MIIERNGKIVGYVEGQTFNADEIKRIDRQNIKTYCLADDMHDADMLTVYAVDSQTALQAIGYGNQYESSWGDYAGLIESIREGNAAMWQKKTEFIPLNLALTAQTLVTPIQKIGA